MGDLNSRMSFNPHFILDDGNNENISNILPEWYKSDYFLPRKSQDEIFNTQVCVFLSKFVYWIVDLLEIY